MSLDGGTASGDRYVVPPSPGVVRHPGMTRTARAARIMIRHQGIPRPLRWLATLALLPIPGPFDEAVLLIVAAILLVFYRRELQEAWGAAAAREEDG